MEMLVTKFSNGKYRNEGELFEERISDENVRLMGEDGIASTAHGKKVRLADRRQILYQFDQGLAPYGGSRLYRVGRII